jgi:hypothetical protein
MARATRANITEFASKHNLQKPTLDPDTSMVIHGKTGQLYEFSDSRLGVIYSSAIKGGSRYKDKTSQRNNTAQAECLAVGMTLEQQGDLECSFSFDPSDSKQSRVAIKTAGAKAKRQYSEAAILARTARLAQWRAQGRSEQAISVS